MKFAKTVLLATTIAAATLASLPASAANVLLPGSGVVLNLANPIAGIGPLKLNKKDNYFFTFETTGFTLDVLEQVQASLLGKKGSTPELISFSLYNGAIGSGTLVGSSGPDYSAVFSSNLPTGWHYIKLGPVAAATELLSGAIEVSPIPEPNTWVSMIFGFGILGGLIRSTRRASAANVA
jgi:hypothetical protein